MTITSVGYAGTITDSNWRRMATAAVGSLYGVDDFASFRPTAGTGDRAVSLAPGGAFGLGVRDESDAPIVVTGAAVSSGSRWDLIVLRRNWGTKVTSAVIVPGSATRALPTRNTGFGALNDQPIALVRFAAGQTRVQEIIDLRCIPADAGVVAFDTLSRSYLDRVGTQVRIGNFLWTRTVDALGSPTWVYVDVTPDTGWTSMALNDGWTGGFSQIRRAGGMVSLRLFRSRAQGWTPPVGTLFRPDQNWYVDSSHASGRAQFVISPTGSITAVNGSAGASAATLHTTYPAALPTF